VGKAQAELTASRARHEKFILTTTAELDERRRKIVAQEMDLRRREGLLDVSAKIQKDTEASLKARFGVTEVIAATGMVREFVDQSRGAPDPHYDGAA